MKVKDKLIPGLIKLMQYISDMSLYYYYFFSDEIIEGKRGFCS